MAPEQYVEVCRVLEPFIIRGKEIVKSQKVTDRLKFLRLQMEVRRVLNQSLPEICQSFGGFINQAYEQIPICHRKTFLPMRMASWDAVSIYELSDWLLHKDEFEVYAQRTKNIQTCTE